MRGRRRAKRGNRKRCVRGRATLSGNPKRTEKGNGKQKAHSSGRTPQIRDKWMVKRGNPKGAENGSVKQEAPPSGRILQMHGRRRVKGGNPEEAEKGSDHQEEHPRWTLQTRRQQHLTTPTAIRKCGRRPQMREVRTQTRENEIGMKTARKRGMPIANERMIGGADEMIGRQRLPKGNS